MGDAPNDTGPTLQVWIDAQLPPAPARWLRTEHGVDAVHVAELGLQRARDPVIFTAARGADRRVVVCTKDDDFPKENPMASVEDYTVVTRPDDNGTFVAYVPAIPGCHAWGQTPDEAQAELVDVFDMIQAEYEEEGRLLPQDVTLVVDRAG